MSQEFVFTNLKRGVVSVRASGEPQPHLTLLWRYALQKTSDLAQAGIPDQPGAYVLADPVPDATGKQTVYVGESARAGLSKRFGEHMNRPKKGIASWALAVCFTGDDQNPNLSGDAASLMEHLLWEDLGNRTGINLSNTTSPPAEPRMTRTEIRILEKYSDTVITLLGTLGIVLSGKARAVSEPPTTPVVANEPAGTRPATKRNPEKISDLLSAGLLRDGEIILSPHPRPHRQAKAVITYDGQIRLLRYAKDEAGQWVNDVSQDNLLFNSPSRAASRVTGKPENGWKFWVVASSGKTLAELRDEYQRLQ